MHRRNFLEATAAGTLLSTGASIDQAHAAEPKRQFRVWAFGCSHVGTDLRVGKRESLAEAIRQSEEGSGAAPAFDWDIALNLGDLSGTQATPSDDEGREVVRQYSVAKKHRREQFYDVAGNHDASGPEEPSMGWFKKWIDPEGTSTRFSGVDPQKRPFPIVGVWERYSFRVGNLLFLMMSDRNDGGPPVGRGKHGGYPSGAVTEETFAWWQREVEQNPNAIVISAHHHMLKETTVASGPWEGYTKKPDGSYVGLYHGYFPDGGPEGASYLYFVGKEPDAQRFEHYLAQKAEKNERAIDLWIGAHTHSHPDDQVTGRTHIETKWNVHFVNCSALTKHHMSAKRKGVPMSRLFTFTEGSRDVRVQCYLHTSDHADKGFYPRAERTLQMSRPFTFA